MNLPRIPLKYNFDLIRGTDYPLQLKVLNCDSSRVNLRSFNIKLQLRKGYTSEVIDEFTTKNLRIVNFSSEGDQIYDMVSIIFDHTHTIEYPLGVLLYDLRIESGNHTYTKILEGQIKCLASITQ